MKNIDRRSAFFGKLRVVGLLGLQKIRGVVSVTSFWGLGWLFKQKKWLSFGNVFANFAMNRLVACGCCSGECRTVAHQHGLHTLCVFACQERKQRFALMERLSDQEGLMKQALDALQKRKKVSTFKSIALNFAVSAAP